MIDVEKIWNMEGVKEARDENWSKLREIEDLIQKAKQAAVGAKAEIVNLEENVLPGLLVGCFRDEKMKSKVTTAKKEKAKFQEIIDDLPLLLKGLEAEKKPFNNSNRKIEHRERHIQIYEKTKNALKQKYSPTLEQDLLDKAEILGCETDARAFLGDFKI